MDKIIRYSAGTLHRDEVVCADADVAQLEAEVDALREANARGDYANERLRDGIQAAMNNIGFPRPEYPAPVTVAYGILWALLEGKEG